VSGTARVRLKRRGGEEAVKLQGRERTFCTSDFASVIIPVTSIPRFLVMGNMCVMLVGSSSLSGTFFCVTIQTLSFPRTAIPVKPADFTACWEAKCEEGLDVRLENTENDSRVSEDV